MSTNSAKSPFILYQYIAPPKKFLFVHWPFIHPIFLIIMELKQKSELESGRKTIRNFLNPHLLWEVLKYYITDLVTPQTATLFLRRNLVRKGRGNIPICNFFDRKTCQQISFIALFCSFQLLLVPQPCLVHFQPCLVICSLFVSKNTFGKHFSGSGPERGGGSGTPQIPNLFFFSKNLAHKMDEGVPPCEPIP